MSEIDPDGPCWGYHESCPTGKVFKSQTERDEAGFVDHPDKVGAEKKAPAKKAPAKAE